MPNMILLAARIAAKRARADPLKNSPKKSSSESEKPKTCSKVLHKEDG